MHLFWWCVYSSLLSISSLNRFLTVEFRDFFIYSGLKFFSGNTIIYKYSSQSEVCPFNFFFFLRFNLFIFREGGGRRRETSVCGCLLQAPYREPGRQPKHVPRLGIEPATPWFSGWCSIHWATPARASLFNLLRVSISPQSRHFYHIVQYALLL